MNNEKLEQLILKYLRKEQKLLIDTKPWNPLHPRIKAKREMDAELISVFIKDLKTLR